MIPLDKTLRNHLEAIIQEARDVAESAARIALEQLGVGEATPFTFLTDQQRDLRQRLRVHGRQLGDSLNSGKIQTLDRLIEETAYEHWHRMLFARFLAENDLLMYHEEGQSFEDAVPVTLEDCAELAREKGLQNAWEPASRLAARMLPHIFRLESPVFALTLPPEHQQALERMLRELPREVFTASDSLGWVYQFWQVKKKEDVNKSEVKIGARELPSVTQLFTEPYMVSFLLDNSLGAWWAGKKLSADAAAGRCFESEEELRQYCAIPGVSLDFLRFVSAKTSDDTAKAWLPAAGTFAGWPQSLSELKVLDPCCGSGHFLVAAFLMLVPLRMELEGLTARTAADAVLRENLHGLELDQRCIELAAFALALTAWKYPDAGGYRKLPELNLACSGLSVSVAKEEWEKLAQNNNNLRQALGEIYETFKEAPTLGSLINPAKWTPTVGVNLTWHDLLPLIEQALREEQSEVQQEVAVVAQGLAKAAAMLSDKYHWIITNVPYIARGKQDETLREFCERNYSAAKNDLATVFLQRCLEFCFEGGTASIVLPQNWLFLVSYKKFRENLLKNESWKMIARLGEGGFDSPAAAGAFAVMLTISRENPNLAMGELFGVADSENLIRGLDVSELRTANEKAETLRTAEIKSIEQAKQLDNPDARVTFDESEEYELLSNFSKGLQ